MTYNGVADSKPKAGNDCTVCPDGAMCSGGTVAPVYSCSSGDYYNGSECVSCDENYYCPGGYEGKKLCPTAYSLADGRATGEKDCYLVLNPGTYVATPHGGQTTCPAGSYCPGNSRVYYNNTGGSKTCPSNSTSGTGASSCTCNAGYNYNGGKTTTSNACVGNTYTIVYDKNGGSGTMSNTACTYGSNCTLRTNAFTKTGHTFAGWSYNGATYSDATAVNILPTTNGATITFTAQWTPETYTLTLDRNGATSGDTTATTQYGAGGFCSAGSKTDTTCLMNLYTPYRTGYKFNGYFTEKTGGTMWIDANGAPVTPTTITSSRTLYAQWTANSYTCSAGTYLSKTVCEQCPAGYYCPGGTRTYDGEDHMKYVCPSNSSSGAGASSCTCNTGYNYNGGTTTTSNACVGNTYTIVYDNNGGSGTMSNTTCTYGSNCILRANAFTKTGHTFAGWSYNGATYSDGTSVNILPTTNGATITFTAQWTANSYTCSAGTYLSKTVCEQCPAGYYCPGGTRTYDGVDHMKYACPSNSTSGAGASSCTCNTGYNYNGGTTTTSNVCVGNTYTIVYDNNGGSGTMSNTACTYGSNCTLRTNAFTKTGHTFAGWSYNGTEYSDGTSVNILPTTNGATMTFVAQWSTNALTCSPGEYLDDATCRQCESDSYCTGGTWNYDGGVHGITKCPGVTDKLGAFDVMFVNTAAQTSVEQCRASFMFAEKWQLSELLGGTDIVPDVNYDEKLNKRGFFFVNCDYDLKSGEYDANCTGVAVLCGAGYVSQFTDSPLENGNFRDFLYHATSPQDAIENTCMSVGEGYWSPGADSCAGMPFDSEKIQCMNRSLIGRNQCPSGLHTIGYGLGADEAGDCGRILHVGDDKVYLRSDKKTTHALRVRVDDTVYYSNMSESDINMNVESERKLRVLYNGVQYCVYDDSVL